MKSEKIESRDIALDLGAPAWPDPNPGRGQEGGYRKIATMLPRWAYELLIQQSARRKVAGEPNQLPSALFREAISDYLINLREQSL